MLGLYLCRMNVFKFKIERKFGNWKRVDFLVGWDCDYLIF